MTTSAAVEQPGGRPREAARRRRFPGWVMPCLAAALAINAVLFFLLPLLTQTRVTPELAGEPMGVNLVRLREPEPPQLEEEEVPRPPPQPPKPVMADSFQPELVQPRLPDLEMPVLNLQVDARILAAPSDIGLQLFYNAEDLDQKPRPVAEIKPLYPFRAKRMAIEGYVKVRFLVDDQGRVSRVTILESDPEGVFDASVVKTLPTWRFHPGRIMGKEVSSWVETKIVFELNE